MSDSFSARTERIQEALRQLPHGPGTPVEFALAELLLLHHDAQEMSVKLSHAEAAVITVEKLNAELVRGARLATERADAENAHAVKQHADDLAEIARLRTGHERRIAEINGLVGEHRAATAAFLERLR